MVAFLPWQLYIYDVQWQTCWILEKKVFLSSSLLLPLSNQFCAYKYQLYMPYIPVRDTFLLIVKILFWRMCFFSVHDVASRVLHVFEAQAERRTQKKMINVRVHAWYKRCTRRYIWKAASNDAMPHACMPECVALCCVVLCYVTTKPAGVVKSVLNINLCFMSSAWKKGFSHINWERKRKKVYTEKIDKFERNAYLMVCHAACGSHW